MMHGKKNIKFKIVIGFKRYRKGQRKVMSVLSL